MHQYAHSGKGHSIHSSPQLEWNGVDVDDKSACVSGKQGLVTFDSFSIPINIRCGQEWEELPHVLLTEDANWDPTHMDHEQGDDPARYKQQDDPPLLNSDFDLCGDYRHRIVYKSGLTSNMYTPTGRILVHENDVFFDTPGDEAFVDTHSNEHDGSLPLFARPTALTTTSALCYTSCSMNQCTTWLMRLLSPPKARNFMDDGLVLARM
jgi:hypothetical protein